MNVDVVEGARGLFRGASAYLPRSGWPALLAVAYVLALFAAALAAAVAVARVLAGAGVSLAEAGGQAEEPGGSIGSILLQLVTMQVVLILGAVLAAGWFRRSPEQTLALGSPAQGPRVYPAAFLLMAVASACYSGAIWLINPADLIADLQPFARMVRSEWGGLAMLAVGLGAPLSEELVFRGFLFSAIAKTRLGVVGATLITTVSWGLLHAGYSVAGLIEVFLIGLFFSWLLIRTGSLWVPMFCHAAYNTAIMLVLRFAPLPF